MSVGDLSKRELQEIWIPVYGRAKPVDRLVAAPGSNPVRIPEGMQFTDSFGGNRALTERQYRAPLSIEATVMTDSTNIVLLYAQGEVILNWDRREDMLHVRHPATGQSFDAPGKGAVPPGRWHHVEWIVAEDVMRVLVDGEERFVLPGNYRGLEGKVGLRTGWRANLSVGSLHIEEHRQAGEGGAAFRPAPHESSFVGCLLGAMRACNRYADETELLGGIGYWFQPLGPAGRFDPDAAEEAGAGLAELLRAYGLVVRRLDVRSAGTDESAVFVRDALKEQVPIFAKAGGADEDCRAVTAVDGTMLKLAGPEGGAEAVPIERLSALYSVRPGPEETSRGKMTAAFRRASQAAQGGDAAAAEWLSAMRESADPAALREQAAAIARKRVNAVRYLRDAADRVGESTGSLLEEAMTFCEAAAGHWGGAAERMAESAAEAEVRIRAAFEAERGGAAVLGRIAEALAGVKLLDGLRYNQFSCISQHITLHGVAKYAGISAPDEWIAGASGRPFAFAVHEKVNVHDICLPLPEAEFVRLFANVGLEIEGVEGYARGEAYRRLLERAWDAARAAIDAGYACFGRSVDFDRGEYSLIVGYDRDGYYSHGWHGRSRRAIPWNMYGLGQCQCLQCTARRLDWRTEGPVKSVCRCDACQRTLLTGPALEPQQEGDVRLYWAKPAAPADDRTIVREALAFAVEFGKPDGKWSKPGMRTGSEAYDLLIRSLERGTMDGWYLGLYANGWQECRQHASRFLNEAKRRLDGPGLAGALEAAAREAERLRVLFAKLYDMFPWMQPFGPIPDTERRYAGAELLRRAKQAEADAMKAYAELIRLL
ncbi:hypothetical protein [Paenibacillus flagellatus]|uniref:Uncharacterized protein n=1 Tax=Paenibacillus flagellatus TaxID=2211139 RepID=A0A2V5KCJ4_9BACL|nr:hypothetical protein [Paenibacillus flagellatus]PYI55673.1 hypothetical protein DLM86_08055 [Paenibacillus flagellatus]